MLNFWSNTTQRIYEVFYGPRTKDTEFEAKLEEMKAAKRSFQGIKQIFFNFFNNTRGTKNVCKDVYANIGQAYSETSPYWSFIVEIGQTYQEAEKLYDTMAEVVQILASQTSEWDKLFDEAEKAVIQREECRRAYDHYDEKLEKLVKTRNDKLQRGQQELPKETERFDRNDIKFKKATDGYIKQSQLAYNLMCELLDYRYKLINPLVTKFLAEQQKYYAAVNELFKKFTNVEAKFQTLDRNLKKSGVDYDPRKYVRGHRLLQGVNTSDLPSLKTDTNKSNKFSYEEYLKSKGQNTGNSGNSGSSGGGNSNTTNNFNTKGGDYSYETYLQSKMGKSVNTNTNVNMNSNLNNNNSYLNNNNFSDFQQFNNNFSNKSYNQPEELRKTTIMPQDDFTLLNKEQEKDTFNPYSSLTLDVNPVRGNNYPSGNNFSSQFSNNNNYRVNMSVNPNTVNNMMSFGKGLVNNNPNMNFPNYNDLNNNTNNNGNNMKFPR